MRYVIAASLARIVPLLLWLALMLWLWLARC